MLQWGHRLSAMETGPQMPPAASALGRFNGATAFRRWKQVPKCPGSIRSWPLQWGHRLSAMETAVVDGSGREERVVSMGPPPSGDGNPHAVNVIIFQGAASMGPPPSGDGNIRNTRESTILRAASMGPLPFDDGNPPTTGSLNPLRRASMGPSPFGDGNCETVRSPCHSIRGFNGAIAFPRWKRGAFPRTRRRGRRCFNGATAFRRWKQSGADGVSISVTAGFRWGHRLSAMETGPGLGSMPGPGALQWGHRLSAMETGYAHGGLEQAAAASMGPPPFGDGNGLCPRWTGAGRCCFNGATAFRRWKQVPASRNTRPTGSLQWGHRLSAMETGYAHGGLEQAAAASMGPPPFGDG